MVSLMVRITTWIVLCGFTACLGCSKNTDVAQNPDAAAAMAAQQVTEPSPTEIVSQFLDQVRRGGEDSVAGELLTKRAQSELRRIGRSVQPIGSPDARFQVTRAEQVPGEAGSALVHSIWSEPAENGTLSDFQVVWAVEQENVGWRISGLAMELAPDDPPIIIDFENGDLMAKLLATTEASQQEAGTTSQAAVPAQGVSR